MISALEVWALAGQGGAPSLFKTLEGYGRRGHQIDFVSSTIGANHHHGAPKQRPPAIGGVDFHLFDLPSLSENRFSLPGTATRSTASSPSGWCAAATACRSSRASRGRLCIPISIGR
jgi:hypothetical protein